MNELIRKHLLFFVVLIASISIYYWKIFIKGYVPFPGDLLVGAYYPWLENTFDYVVGVPVKNPLISDVFSQIYPWKVLIAQSIHSFRWPLWNPYSYFGYPLLANLQSGAFNIFNLLMVLFGNIKGWSMMIISQTAFSFLAMYLFLRNLKLDSKSSIMGGFVYAFGGFAVIWSQFASVGFSMVWIPLIMLCIESFARKSKLISLTLLPPIIFGLTSSGHFQSIVYGIVFSIAYYLYRSHNNKTLNQKNILILSFFFLLGFGLSAIQLIPTIELSTLSIRFKEVYIKNVNYGLLPLSEILKLYFPDFYGNPATGNYWGSFNYQETVLYCGIAGIMAFVHCAFNYKKLGLYKFFFIVSLLSLTLAFDNSISKLIYIYKLPLISTSAAGRIIVIFSFCVSALVAHWISKIKFASNKQLVRTNWPLLATTIMPASLIFWIRHVYQSNNQTGLLNSDIINLSVSLRNLVFPFLIILSLLLTVFMTRKTKYFWYIVLVITAVDLFRFGWKYTPFVPPSYVFPDTPATDFLKSQADIFRVEKERGPILTPNTWIPYGLTSPSGYDPMVPIDNALYFEKTLNNNDNLVPSRYSEINQYNAKSLGNVNVKYLLVIKRTEAGEYKVGGNSYYYKIREDMNWQKVFESDSVYVLENKLFKPRVEILDKQGNTVGKASITVYTPNYLEISYESNENASLVLYDSWFPGWIAKIDEKPVEVLKQDEFFRKVLINQGSGKITFDYKPKSFLLGQYLSLTFLGTWLIITIYIKLHYDRLPKNF